MPADDLSTTRAAYDTVAEDDARLLADASERAPWVRAVLAVARRALPGLRFVEGSMTALDLPDGALGGLAAWYLLIHVPPDDVPAVLAGSSRVLAPGGRLLLASQVGDERRHLDHAYSHPVALEAYRMRPDRLAGQLERAGLPVTARVVREPEAPETVPQAYRMAGRAG